LQAVLLFEEMPLNYGMPLSFDFFLILFFGFFEEMSLLALTWRA